MIIRKAIYDDVKKLNELLTLLIQDEKQYDEGINDNFVVTNMYENYIEDKTKLILVAEEDNNIVGYLYGKLEESDETYKYKVAILDALYVIEEYRQKGIADSLINEFKNWAKLNNVNLLKVNVCSKNIKAKKLYEKHNFIMHSETLRKFL